MTDKTSKAIKADKNQTTVAVGSSDKKAKRNKILKIAGIVFAVLILIFLLIPGGSSKELSTDERVAFSGVVYNVSANVATPGSSHVSSSDMDKMHDIVRKVNSSADWFTNYKTSSYKMKVVTTSDKKTLTISDDNNCAELEVSNDSKTVLGYNFKHEKCDGVFVEVK